MARKREVGLNGLTAAVAAATLFALVACAPESEPQVEAPPPQPPQPILEPVVEAPAPPAPPRPAHKPQAPATVASATPATESPEPVPPTTESRGIGDFDRLIGLDQPATAELLGEPKQRAESPPATIWRYLSRDCELDVYFYLDLQAKEMRTLHYEVRNHDDAAERPQQRCYDELVSERQPPVDSNGSTNRPD